MKSQIDVGWYCKWLIWINNTTWSESSLLIVLGVVLGIVGHLDVLVERVIEFGLLLVPLSSHLDGDQCDQYQAYEGSEYEEIEQYPHPEGHVFREGAWGRVDKTHRVGLFVEYNGIMLQEVIPQNNKGEGERQVKAKHADDRVRVCCSIDIHLGSHLERDIPSLKGHIWVQFGITVTEPKQIS